MPALPHVPNVIQAIVNFASLDGHHNAINKLHYAYGAGTPTAADLSSFAADIGNAYTGGFTTSTYASPKWTLTTVNTLDLATAIGNAGSHNVNVVGAGTSALPASVAGLINWHIARHYRGGKPKTFVPGLAPVAITDEEVMAAGAVTQLNILAANLINGSNLGSPPVFGSFGVVGLVNVSYYSGFTNFTKPSGRESSRPTVRAVAVVDTIQSGAASPRYSTQRRRLNPS